MVAGVTFRHVLIPLDGSDVSANVLSYLGPICGIEGVTSTLLRVVAPSELQGLSAEEARRSAGEAMKTVQSDLLQRGWTVAVEVEQGDPAEQILKRSSESSADLVAMFSHGKSGISRLVRGSVAERVLRRSTVPVLLCTPRSPSPASGQNAFKKIVVPLDGSALANQVLPVVEALALACRSEVTLLRVEVDHYPGPPDPDVNPEWWTPERVEASVAHLRPQCEALEQSGVTVKPQTVYDQPVQGILGAAENADLLAMTTHGCSGVSRWFFGSVAEAVLREARCPILLQRCTESP